MKAVYTVLLTTILILSGFLTLLIPYTITIIDQNEMYREILCDTQLIIDQANPLDPAIARLQVVSWYDDICKDYSSK